MRNLIIAAVVLASAVSVLVYQRSVLAKTREATALLTDKNEAFEKELAEQARALEEMKNERNLQKQALERAERELKEKREEQKPLPRSLPDPSLEGVWPATRPYFYLPKKHIPGLEYDAFTGAGRISEEAAALFGISTAERRGIEGALRKMFVQLRTQELKHATLTNTPSDVKGRPGNKISIWLPPADDVPALKEEVSSRIAEVLGGQRAALFLERAAEAEKQFDSLSTVERVVTIIPKDQDSGEIVISTESGSMFNYYHRKQPQDWMQVQYGHLIDAFVPTHFP